MKKIFVLLLTFTLCSCTFQSASRYYLLSEMTKNNITLFEPGTQKGSWGKQLNDPHNTMFFLEFFSKIEVKLYQNSKTVTIHSLGGELTRNLTYDPQRKLYYNYEGEMPVTFIVTRDKSGERIKFYMTFLETVICFSR